MEKRKIWVYCRVAYKGEDDFILNAQVDYLKHYAAQNGHSIIGVTAEYGSGLTLNRPGWMEVVEAVQKGAVDAVLVKNLCRIARDLLCIKEAQNFLNNQGVMLISVVDGITHGWDREHF